MYIYINKKKPNAYTSETPMSWNYLNSVTQTSKSKVGGGGWGEGSVWPPRGWGWGLRLLLRLLLIRSQPATHLDTAPFLLSTALPTPCSPHLAFSATSLISSLSHSASIATPLPPCVSLCLFLSFLPRWRLRRVPPPWLVPLWCHRWPPRPPPRGECRRKWECGN